MKPYVILHMGSSIDGRIVTSQWPKEMTAAFTAIYERLHQQMGGDAWIVGRVTMAEFAEGDPRPVEAGEVFPRTTWKAPGAGKGPYAIAVDQGARLHMNIDMINGDPIVMILPETVPDNHLAELRRDGISYLFAGRHEIDLALALERIRADFGTDRLLLEGGGGINGSFRRAHRRDQPADPACCRRQREHADDLRPRRRAGNEPAACFGRATPRRRRLPALSSRITLAAAISTTQSTSARP
ncbi:riboflavin biosynthesis pyrimidine reductase [Rhizobium sp. BK060]|nr:riboflavin biosynthesis pyrimidine reductase [Rhizobium sp. BK060]